MTSAKFDICAGVGMIGAFIGYALGAYDGMLKALIIFIAVDYITGVINAIITKKLNSEIGYKGLLKKAMELLAVVIGHTIDKYVVGSGNICRMSVILFYLCNELISITENYCKIGLPFPKKLKQILQQLQNEK